ncbi:hypothetical protein GGE12_005778 [Rhizobium mongolense]|uniref:Uncharacterized protein n=1 Tax=Rhizobium mongolense TaxID=57676 RepID=A0A7W6WHL7_9HYPH|nr:hypothetical protein [Rhizobium mongolense]
MSVVSFGCGGRAITDTDIRFNYLFNRRKTEHFASCIGPFA